MPGLESGVWKHQISVGLQNESMQSILVGADPTGTPNMISWMVFTTVLTVDRTDDSSTNPVPQCPSAPGTQTCTLRQAMSLGATAAPPLLVQFDPTVFPVGVPTTVQLAQSANLPFAGYQMVVDGRDPDGTPSFAGDPYNRIVQLPSAGGSLVFTNGLGAVIGLFIQRPALSAGAQPKDIVVFDGSSGRTQQNTVLNCKVDGGGGSLTGKLQAQDCIEGLNGAGSSWSGANLIKNTELTGCPDKGVKATTLAYVRVEDSWIYRNIGGGVQATLSGNIEADRNVIELNGYNASAQVFPDANGLSTNGADQATPTTPSVLHTTANIIRNNSSRGISVQELSTATITNDFSCGATNGGTGGQNGIAIFNSTASAASATVRGTTTVYNGRNGATVANQSTGDFGQANPDPGNNAFTQNATNSTLGGHNFDDSSTTQTSVPASNDQWQHCYADPTHPAATCDGNINLDINGAVTLSPPEPYRADATTLPIMIQSLAPTKAQAGDLVHITGSGFNAVDGYPPGGDCVVAVQQTNTCSSPIVGTCVQYEAAPGVWAALQVQSVTPTHIVAQLPATFTCSQPVTIRVQRLDYTGTPVAATKMFCTNS